MLGLVILAAVVGGVLLLWLRLAHESARWLLDVLAVAAYLLFFGESAHAVMKTLLDDTVFMTQVHEVLLSPLFLISGAYFGPYGLSLLLAQIWRRDK
ncbi:hypothetical protein [Paenibacillus sacheonensis]|uniref:Uncharacterized protein n=1 Tax=Paenibacillus sacheonensis TaxID=742054 RepID=A0A7X4YSF9_9BACL|nr:hypothetical protein [Paenibacillus sacheonensis]MBM7566731.1 hypothetical protein [Paenibacillus sacheonensis]NBC71693.1 hypothetical protein [Paenibacillus sacheonensis]